MRVKSLLLTVVCLGILVALPAVPRASAAEPPPEIPAEIPAETQPDIPAEIPDWLQAHVGNGNGQINQVVLERARAHYLQKVSAGVIKNPCYFAKDATRPAGTGRRFYVICETDQTFRAISSGHGNGRKLRGANFANGIRCAKHFSNAEGSKLTTGGAYVTAETRPSFKGYYRSRGKRVPFVRSFLQFEGEGDTANARERAIGGHPAVLLRAKCRFKYSKSPYANKEGYVPYGRLLNYSAGRSNGCTSWTPGDSEKIFEIVKDQPTTLYLYPESGDIDAVAKAVKAGKLSSRSGLYWNASCLREIRAPKFWTQEKLDPIIVKYRKDHPPGPYRPLPICK